MESINTELYHILERTLESDKILRIEAEKQLEAFTQQLPDFPVDLLRFATQPVASLSPSRCHSIFLAAAIRFRNIICYTNWNRNPSFSEETKEAIRSLLIPLQCEPHVEEHIRRQLLAVANEILQYDYPSRWSQVLPQISEILESATLQLSATPLSAMPKVGEYQPLLPPSNPSDTNNVLLRIKGGLGVLRYCCKVHETALDTIPAETVETFFETTIPSLLQLFSFLSMRWEHEAQRLHASLPSVGGDAAETGEKNVFELSNLLSELSHCLRLIMKCFWSLCAKRWPAQVCKPQIFQEFFYTCLQKPTEILHTYLFPQFQKRITDNVVQTNRYGGRFDEFQGASVWRLMKWIGAFMLKLIELFSVPKHCERRCRPIAKIFCEKGLMLYISSYSIDLIRWHSSLVSLNSKAYIMALECITLLVPEEHHYTAMLHPAAEELLVHLLFPRLAFTSEDVELWNLNPEEYVRKQSNPIGDLFNPKVISSSLMVSLVVPSKPFHDRTLSQKLLEFVEEQLETYSVSASQTFLGEPSSPEMEAPRRIDSSLYCLCVLGRTLKVSAWPSIKEPFENILLRYVVPATRYPIGFLRARAVQVLSIFASKVEWSSPQIFHQVLQSVLPLLQDPETPVQVQTCTSFSLFLHHPYAFEVINPCIAEVVAQYFHVMRMIDNEAVVRTLRKTIRYYSSSLSQWAMELTEMICQHFLKMLETVSGKYVSWNSSLLETASGELGEDDNFVDVLMTADELLETLTVLVKSLPSASPETQFSSAQEQRTEGVNFTQEPTVSALMCGIQERVAPLLQLILSYRGGSAYGFMDPCLRLLATLIARSTSVVPSMWVLLSCLHRLVFSGAVDYFRQMLTPLVNYSSVEPLRFSLVPFGSLCPPLPTNNPYFDDPAMMQWTPAQIVIHMGEFVFHSSSLRLQEKASAPKIYDAFLQNYWWAVTVKDKGTQIADSSARCSGMVTESSLPTPQESYQTIRMLAEAVTTASLSPLLSSSPSYSISSPTMRVLLSNAVFSSLLADWIGTCCSLEKMNMFPRFFEAYVSLASNPDVANLLRGYDRRLVVAAVTEGIRGVQQCREGVDPTTRDWGNLANGFDNALHSIVASQILLCFAQLDAKEIQEETAALLKYQERHKKSSERGRMSGRDGEEDEEDSDWEDEDEDEEDMWENNFGSIEGVDTDWEEEDDCDAANLDDEASDFLQLIQKARDARERGKDRETEGGACNMATTERREQTGDDAIGDHDEEGDNNENLLLEEDVEAPILDKVNAWVALMDGALVARNVSHAAASFFSPDFQEQYSAITRAAEALQKWSEVRWSGK